MQDRIEKIKFIHGLFKKELDELLKFANSAKASLTETQGPPMDIVISDRDVTLYVELPGLCADDFTVYQLDDLVVIEGMRPKEQVEMVRFIRVEREAVWFRRVVRLPFCVNDSETTAKLKDGILTVKISRCACEIE
ncbi:Hsp20/alpha crystallin family protein [Seleniivibrio woodruffii]|uniref:HSP20 family protein n=1 Tax=Seleniivibrio woodruffii TaxID=1078050 RepID=A0A4R1K303_9BACT|nr:Hsp20/alpha crystallin family protein [Seleniivibrio woodruffii]TCK58330.1 HSP20 family protein [Seleniivibrio woodruffii]TVZ36704.1 HSP20 family protein [Seleniivibrio woodruffii]